jgi:hypothetical protein
LDRCLRSRTVASIEYEVAGHVVYYLLVRWFHWGKPGASRMGSFPRLCMPRPLTPALCPAAGSGAI